MKRPAIAAALLLAHCATPNPDGRATLVGRWGGEQIALALSADGSGRIDLSCAFATFAGPVMLDVGGHFLTNGEYVRGTGVATVDPPAAIPATISGRLDRDGILWLDIAAGGSYPVRSARLRRGAEPQLLRCL